MKLEPGSIRLFRWPFIHTRLCSLIEKCTSWEPEERPSFEEIKQELSSIQGTDSSIGRSLQCIEVSGYKLLFYHTQDDPSISMSDTHDGIRYK